MAPRLPKQANIPDFFFRKTNVFPLKMNIESIFETHGRGRVRCGHLPPATAKADQTGDSGLCYDLKETT